MPQYYFHYQDGATIAPDDTGTECADDEDACTQAMLGIGDLAQQHLPTSGPEQHLEMRVSTADGRSFLHLDLRLTVTPLSK